MANMIIFPPTREMIPQAERVVREMNVDAVIRYENSSTIVKAAEEEQNNGALVAVARGNQANVLLRESSIPLIEIVVSGQNLAKLFYEAKKLSMKENPRIALVGFQNMFGDVTVLAEVLDIQVRTFFAENSEGIRKKVEDAAEWQADVLIGGEMAVSCGAELGMTCLFLHSTDDSIETAVKLARRVLYAIELEKKRTAEVTSLMDYSFDGVLKLDPSGTIVYANYLAERIFRQDAKSLSGREITSLLYLDDPENPLVTGIRTHTNVFGCPVRIRRTSENPADDSDNSQSQVLMANLAAINVYSNNEGFILSLQESKRIEELEEGIRRERNSHENVARSTFADLKTASPAMKRAKDMAMRYARYNHPILLVGENGVGKRRFAECIHNFSLRADKAFISVDCGGLSNAMQEKMFMGDGSRRGVFYEAHTATLLIENVDYMAESCQYQLLHVLDHGDVVLNEGRIRLAVNIRVICTTTQDLYQKVKEGKFLNALYSRLTQLQLTVPPLSQRREDLPELLETCIEKYGMIYRRYITLTPEAKQIIFDWNWFGQVRQLELFCEKLVMIAEDKVITGDYIRRYLPVAHEEDALPETSSEGQRIVVVSDMESARIMDALREYKGNREAVANALGISKTTLWRKMKKYNIDKKYR